MGIRQQMLPGMVPAVIFIAAVISCITISSKAFAGMILDAELKLTYEDNVVGLLSDQGRGNNAAGGGMGGFMKSSFTGTMGGGNPNKTNYLGKGSGSTQSPGDFSSTLSAEAGGYRELGENAEVFAKGFAENQTYDTYTDLDSIIGGVSTGVNVSLTDTVSGRAAIIGKVKRFGDSQRDSTSSGGYVSLKEKLTRAFWLREFVEYEKNHAESSRFSYTGTSIGAGAGYALTRNMLLTFGYSYLVQEYEEPAGAWMKTDTVYVSAERTLTKSWSLAGQYDLQVSKTNGTGTSAIDDVFSLALRYSY